MKTLKYIGPWLVVIMLGCMMINVRFQHMTLLNETTTLQHQVDSLTRETDSLNAAVKTREQINNTLIQTLK